MSDKDRLNYILSEIKKQAEIVFSDKLDSVILYGSYARGDFDEESDIDIMVRIKCKKEELNKYMYLLSDVASSLSLKYDVTVSVIIFDTETFYKYENAMPFLCNVKKDGVIVV